MAAVSILRYFIFLIVTLLKLASAETIQSFSFQGFTKDANFDLNFAMYGDAKVVNGTSSVQLTRSVSLSAGQLVHKKPISLVEGNPRKLMPFSTYFSFSLYPQKGDGIAFIMAPIRFLSKEFYGSYYGLSHGLNESETRIFAVELDTSKDRMYDELNGKHVGIDVGNVASIRKKNASSINLVLKSGEILHCWIDYEAGSKRIEVRMSESGGKKPVDPLVVYSVDFSAMWKEEQVFVGVSSSNVNASQICLVHSWSFKKRSVPQWMHSQPLDPGAYVKKTEPEPLSRVPKKNSCILRVIAALIFGIGCGALGAFIVLFVCNIFGNRLPVEPEEFAVHPHPMEYKCGKKLVIVVDISIEDGDH